MTTSDILSWLGCAVVTHPLWVHGVSGSIPGSDKGFYVWFLVLLLLGFYFLFKNTFFVTHFCNSFYNVNVFSILIILQDLWPGRMLITYIVHALIKINNLTTLLNKRKGKFLYTADSTSIFFQWTKLLWNCLIDIIAQISFDVFLSVKFDTVHPGSQNSKLISIEDFQDGIE